LTDHNQRFEIIIQKLRDNGHKITPQRLAIVKILAKSEGHPSVENIHARIKKDFPTMSLATVYKNILLIKSIPIHMSSASSVKKLSTRTWKTWMK